MAFSVAEVAPISLGSGRVQAASAAAFQGLEPAVFSAVGGLISAAFLPESRLLQG